MTLTPIFSLIMNRVDTCDNIIHSVGVIKILYIKGLIKKLETEQVTTGV